MFLSLGQLYFSHCLVLIPAGSFARASIFEFAYKAGFQHSPSFFSKTALCSSKVLVNSSNSPKSLSMDDWQL